MTSKSPGYVAMYFQKTGLWGWRLKDISLDALGIPISYMKINGKLFAWGSIGTKSAQSVIYKSNQTTFTGTVGLKGFWHIQFPFTHGPLPAGKWLEVLSTGKTIPIYK